ncbi:hypothetical protein PTKIN_Ptkin07bG0272600 [Pterospermum kingtungense]
MKSACDIHLASLVGCIEDALVLIEYGLEERENVLVASCLQVLLRDLPSSLYNPKVIKIFCSFEARERLASAGNASFFLYCFLSHMAMEDNLVSNITVMLLERLRECATEKWQKRPFEAFFLKAYTLEDSSLDSESSSRGSPSGGLRKGQALNNLGTIYVDCGGSSCKLLYECP